MAETRISIPANDVTQERSHQQPGWWERQRVDICVNYCWFVLGRASGEGCACLTYSLHQVLPTSIFDVAAVRAELEQRHLGCPTDIESGDFLDLATYWADIIDIIGHRNSQ